MNTAARMEGSGSRNMIHISKSTKSYLEEDGKGHWARERESQVTLKGKGLVQTYWLECSPEAPSPAFDSDGGANTAVSFTTGKETAKSLSSKRTERLVEWVVDVLSQQLKKIVAMREVSKSKSKTDPADLRFDSPPNATVLDEVQEIIGLCNKESSYKQDPDSIDLGAAVMKQLQDFVTKIASMYHANSFHCFGELCPCAYFMSNSGMHF